MIALAAPDLLRAQETAAVRNNISSFRIHAWQDHFDTLGKGVFLSDTKTMALQHWTADDEINIYPKSVPPTDELTCRGYTEVIRNVERPSWAPMPSMKESNLEWPHS